MTFIYLAAIVGANLIVTEFGPGASVITAFLLIGLVITTRDRLHEAWSGNGLRWKMAALIATGGLLSYLVNADAGRIALASFVAFAVSETADAIVYHRLRDRGWYIKVNGSNVGSAALDSILFPTLAFGLFLPWVILGQFVAKVFGGAIWSWILRPRSLVLLLLLVPTSVSAQILAVGVGSATTQYGTNVVNEWYLSSPPVTSINMRLYGIASIQFNDINSPTFVTAIDAPIVSGAWGWTALGPGLVWLPFNDYRPRGTVTSTTGLNLYWRGWQGIVIGSTEVADLSDNWVVVVKLSYTLAFKR